LEINHPVQNSEKTFIYVNQRPVQDKKIEKILKKTFLDKYPIGIVSLTAPSEIVDVNLDPNKATVMIGKQNQILDFLESELKIIYNFNDKEVEVLTNVKTINLNESLVSLDESLNENVKKRYKAPTVLLHEEIMAKKLRNEEIQGANFSEQECIPQKAPTLLPHEEIMAKELRNEEMRGTKISEQECMPTKVDQGPYSFLKVVPSGDSCLHSTNSLFKQTTQ
jgi:DNA mismatch repair ATPase MutL